MASAAIQALLFDYGLTLVTFSRPDGALLRAHAEVARRLQEAGLGPVPPAETLLAEVHDRVEHAVARHDAMGRLREIDAAAEERRAYATLGLQLSDELLDEIAAITQEAWREGAVVAEGAVDTLAELRGRGLRLGLCSNASYRSASLHAQLAHLGLAGLFDSVTFSSEPLRDGGRPPPRGHRRRSCRGDGEHPDPRASGRPRTGRRGRGDQPALRPGRAAVPAAESGQPW
jgi:phosphoglycolate phosphatase-like HAD superfamily hydrolase